MFCLCRCGQAPGYEYGPRSPVLLGSQPVRDVGYVSPPAVVQTVPAYVSTYRAPVQQMQQMQYVQSTGMREIDEVLPFDTNGPLLQKSCFLAVRIFLQQMLCR